MSSEDFGRQPATATAPNEDHGDNSQIIAKTPTVPIHLIEVGDRLRGIDEQQVDCDGRAVQPACNAPSNIDTKVTTSSAERAIALRLMSDRIAKIEDAARREAAAATLPDDLAEHVERVLCDCPGLAWEEAVARVVGAEVAP